MLIAHCLHSYVQWIIIISILVNDDDDKWIMHIYFFSWLSQNSRLRSHFSPQRKGIFCRWSYSSIMQTVIWSNLEELTLMRSNQAC